MEQIKDAYDGGEIDPRDVLCAECRPRYDAAMKKAIVAAAA